MGGYFFMDKTMHSIITKVIIVAYSIRITLFSDSLLGFYVNRGSQSLCYDYCQERVNRLPFMEITPCGSIMSKHTLRVNTFSLVVTY